MTGIERLPEATAASIQASLLTVTVEDIFHILFRYALDKSRATFGTSSGRTTFLVDYATWTINVAHEADRSSITASDQGNLLHLEAGSELRLLSYLGLVHFACTSAGGASSHIWQEGRVSHSSVPATPPPSMNGASSRGLIVSLRNVFSGMPVRRKYLASEALKRSHTDSLIRCVRQLSLLNPQSSIQLSIRHAPRSDGTAPSSKTLLSLTRAPSLLHRCVDVFGADAVELGGVRDVVVEQNFDKIKMKVHGFVCTTATSNAPQIIFVQGRVWPGTSTRTGSHGADRESAAFAGMLSKYGLSWSDDTAHRPTRETALSPALYQRVDRRIAAVPGASLPDDGTAHAFVLVVALSRTRGDAEGPARHRKGSFLNAASFEETLLNAICGDTTSAGTQPRRKRKRSDKLTTADEPMEEGRARSARSSRPATASLARESFGVGSHVPEGFVEWRDPMKGTLFHIDRRTGHSLAVTPGNVRATGLDRSSLKKGLDFALSRQKDAHLDYKEDEFDDPSLDAALASIPSPSPATPISTPRRKSRFFDSRRPDATLKTTDLCGDERHLAHRPTAGDLELAITRELLQGATVLDQVDDKFILCSASLSPSTEPVLLCIDQHAADERYRLERMTEDFVSDCISDRAAHPLDATMTLAITRKDYDVLESNDKARSEMDKLGWKIERAVMVHERLGHAQVDLKGIPHILRERVLADTGRLKDEELLTKILKSCIEEVASGSHAFSRSTSDSSDEDWLALSLAIPTSLMDLMKNKACRSAIMFNDPLSREAAERLVRRLGKCKFPFMCAHGRPSLVPLCQVKTTAREREQLDR